MVPATQEKSAQASLLPGSFRLWSGQDDKGVSSGVDASLLITDFLPLLLEQHAIEKKGWKRTLSATIALLRTACRSLDDAETAIAIQNERIAALEALATSDELTGLKNRRGIFQAMSAELDRCNRGLSEGGVLALIDLDNFKTINDVHGHMAGDACLRLVAGTLMAEVREMDCAGRLGGDEFVLLLSSTTKKKAVSRIQRFGWRLNNLALAWKGSLIPIRASLGLKEFRRGDKPDLIFSAADVALYSNKVSRRSRLRKAAAS